MPGRSVAHALSLPGTDVKVNGFSKGYAMTGWRLGYVAGPLPAIQLINKVHGQTTGCCSSVSQMAGIAGLGMGDAFIKEMCEEYRCVSPGPRCVLLVFPFFSRLCCKAFPQPEGRV
jgi:aspartate/methionine/tyrosine aminotransferase